MTAVGAMGATERVTIEVATPALDPVPVTTYDASARASVGVPEMTPVEELMLIPFGRLGETMYVIEPLNPVGVNALVGVTELPYVPDTVAEVGASAAILRLTVAVALPPIEPVAVIV